MSLLELKYNFLISSGGTNPLFPLLFPLSPFLLSHSLSLSLSLSVRSPVVNDAGTLFVFIVDCSPS